MQHIVLINCSVLICFSHSQEFFKLITAADSSLGCIAMVVCEVRHPLYIAVFSYSFVLSKFCSEVIMSNS
jgi:hypothetical protein